MSARTALEQRGEDEALGEHYGHLDDARDNRPTYLAKWQGCAGISTRYPARRG
jgi:hypothetical protein